MLTQTQRNAIRKREQAATKGPWEFEYKYTKSPETTQLVIEDVKSQIICDTLNADRQEIHQENGSYFEGGQRLADIEFICVARTVVPQLLDDLDVKDKEIAKLQETIQRALQQLQAIRKAYSIRSEG